MKRFVFALDRALEWRRTQQRLEEVKLERLHAELRALESRLQILADEHTSAVAALAGTGMKAALPVTGFDLAALDRYRRSTTEEASRLAAFRVELTARITAQTRELAVRRRDVRLIERLREQRFQSWRTGFLQEIDRQAEEAHIAKFSRTAASPFGPSS